MSLVPLGIGFLFAWLLSRSGLTKPDVVRGVFMMRDATVLRFLLAALVAGSMALAVFRSLGLATDAPVPDTALLANLAGGVVFGAGMALSGFCPGTVAAGAGEGRLDNLVAGSGGMLAGSVAFGVVHDAVVPRVSRVGRLGSVRWGEWLGVDDAWVVVVIAELAFIALYTLARAGRRKPAEAG